MGETVIIILLSVSILLQISLLLVNFFKKPVDLSSRLEANRSEIIAALGSSMESFGKLLMNSNEQFSRQQGDKIDLLINTLDNSLKQLQSATSQSSMATEQKLENIRQSVEKSLTSAADLTEKKLENIRISVDKAITNLQAENTKKLEDIRQTVDEKLQKTLEERLSKSFQLVSERLEQVYKGLGEMQNLASGVGDLKKVLSNVKTRGILGEIQLANILEEIMTPEQYDTNVVTKKGSRDRVEFAIRLPGEDHIVYLPIDAKFPLDDYQTLREAYEVGNSEAVKQAQTALTRKIKAFAKDINSKYIDVPNTTEFAIMFLPVEGLYAEVINLGIVEELQRSYKINVSGPTTMAALLNSLQMGFRTLAIQKRSGEVWKILGAVKTEFSNFSKVLEITQKRINQAGDELDRLVGTRTRMIQRKLSKVTELPETETEIYLPSDEEE